MRRKEPKPSAFKDVDPNPEFIEEKVIPSKTGRKISLCLLTREEKIQEASKPLYLKRYE